jgi:thioredoxin-like negative regulator of GroEL
VLKDGREIDRITGAVPAATLREMLERHVAAQAGDAVS